MTEMVFCPTCSQEYNLDAPHRESNRRDFECPNCGGNCE